MAPLGLGGLAYLAAVAATPVLDEVGLLQVASLGDEESPAPRWFLLELPHDVEVPHDAEVPPAASAMALTAERLGANASFPSVQRAWQNKFGPHPTFLIEAIDYHGHLPRFNYMFPKGESDQWQVEQQAVLEPFVSYNLVQDLRACCGAGGRFVDVGGNMGWYTLMMASLGCRVDVFEPVPWFSSLLGFNSASVNEAGVGERITAHFGKILGTSVGPRRTMVVPTQGLTGAASVDGANARGTCGSENTACFDVGMTTLDSELASSRSGQAEECGLKIDVEGYEPDVISGSREFLPAALPKVIAIELSPGMQQGHGGRNQTMNLEMLQYLTKLGYAPHHLDWQLIKNKNYDTIRGTSMASRRFDGSAQALIERCGFNCMVYFTRP